MEYNEDKISSEMRWIDMFFKMCDVISSKSKDPSTKVGCIITSGANSIISAGFNGFPIGVNDNIIVIPESPDDIIEKSKRYERPQKYLWTSHAEENAIAFAARNGVSTNGATLYVNKMIPCSRCARLIIQSGIKKVYVLEDAKEEAIGRWKEDNDIAQTMFEEAGVKLTVFTK